jgi:hypothetical protein
MTYELFDTDTGNIVGVYASEREALDVLRDAIAAYGMTYADTLVLGTRDMAGYPTAVAAGQDLAKRALSSAPAP